MFRTLQSPDWPAICARHPYFGTHKSAFGNRLKCALRWGLSGNRFISIRRLECVVFVCEGCRRQIFFESHPLAWYVNLWELPGTWQVAKHFSEVCPLEWWGVGYVTEVPLQILRRYQSNMVRPWHFWPRTTVSHILSFFCARRTSIEEAVNLDFSSLCRQVTSAFGRSVPSRSIELLVCLHSSPFLSDFQFRRAIFSS